MAPLLNSTSTVTRVASYAVIGSISQIGAGVTTRFAGSMLTNGFDVEKSTKAAFDLQGILMDGAIGGIFGGMQGGLTKPQTFTSSQVQQLKGAGGGVGNPVKVEGRGSTGRTTPNSLNEQMTMYQVQSNPLEGATKIPLEMTDPRWSESEGWVKMQSIVQNADGQQTVIHFVYNGITGAFDDFKFK